MELFSFTGIGENNKIRNYDNQDAMYEKKYKNYRVMAVSDGAGSCEHSGIAAKTACEAAVNYWINNIQFIKRAKENVIAENTLTVVEYHLKKAAIKNGHDYRKYCCTLVMCMKNVRTGELITLHIGDGSIYEYTDKTLKRISNPENGSSSCYTYFTNDRDVKQHCRVQKYKNTNGIMICSDGLDHLFKTGAIPMKGFTAGELTEELFTKLSLSDDTTVIALKN